MVQLRHGDSGDRGDAECLRARPPWRLEQQGQPRQVPAKEVRENALTQDCYCPSKGREQSGLALATAAPHCPAGVSIREGVPRSC